MFASFKAYIRARSEENSSWLVSLVVHVALLCIFGFWLVPEFVRPAPVAIDSRFSGSEDLTRFDAAFDMPQAIAEESTGGIPSQLTATDVAAHLPRYSALDQKSALASGPAAFTLEQGTLGADLGKQDSGQGSSGFFGLSAAGKRFVYIVDASGSMEGRRFRRAKAELIRSLRKLRSGQEFFVIFYNFDAHVMPKMSEMVPVSRRNLKAVQRWVTSVRPVGPTYPNTALQLALDLKPDAIYFLSDGVFDPAVLRGVQRANTSHVTIHAIGFEDRVGEVVLQLLANQNGGKYRFVR